MAPKLRLMRDCSIAFCFVWLALFYYVVMHPNSTGIQAPDINMHRIAEVSMLYGDTNEMYERALFTHERHAKIWGHPMHTLRQDISAGVWNKPTYLSSLVIAELAKPAGRRMEWLMWVDSDIIILNDEIPVEIFLPPSDMKDIHLVASQDQNGLDSGVMFLHVHPWTVSLLTEIMAYPLYLPGIDLGQSADPEGMGRVLNKTTGGPSGKGYTDGVVYLPRPWINAYQRDMVYEGNKGDLLVHFPELEKRQWQYMAKWLDATENMPHEWDVSLQETGYLDRTTIYWSLLRRARNTVESLEKKMQSGGSLPGRPMEKIANFKKALRENSDDMELIQTQLNALDALFG
ncbi:unnamed protein product [Penicillium olsonii]|nr:unnamed protein product [Penicillium olsonii]CAG7923923.1 unnamed protein product [Penicillium olsonii]